MQVALSLWDNWNKKKNQWIILEKDKYFPYDCINFYDYSTQKYNSSTNYKNKPIPVQGTRILHVT